MNTVKEELEALCGDELLRADDVVSWAKAHPESALHSQFEWDDAKAAHEHRVWQARRLIALHIVTDAGDRRMISLVIDRTKGGGYRAIEDVTASPDLRAIMLADALAELKRVRRKYERLKELSRVFAEVDRVERAHAPQRERASA